MSHIKGAFDISLSQFEKRLAYFLKAFFGKKCLRSEVVCVIQMPIPGTDDDA